MRNDQVQELGSERTALTGAAGGSWRVAAQTAAALAAAMGVGRFVFTPILPLMETQSGLTRQGASLLATGNYLGYLLGGILGILVSGLGRARRALRTSGLVLIASLVVMPLTHDVATWVVIRGLAGVASAVMFMVAGHTILTRLASSTPRSVGWAYGGVGAGIAASGILIAVVGAVGDWRAAWWSASVLTAVLVAVGWPIGESGNRPGSRTAVAATRRGHRARFALLAGSYFLEGTGYIIAGTFLVAAVSATGPRWLGSSVWIIVGLAVVPSSALWTWLSTRASRPSLIAGALVLQAIGMGLPALSAGPWVAVVAAALFGVTFVGITTLSLATGRHLGIPGAIAILTAGYGIGQVIGPLVVTPLLGNGYRPALLVGSAIVLAGAVAALFLRVGFPHYDQPHHGARLVRNPLVHRLRTVGPDDQTGDHD
ncbi:MFS transporter [Microlunatus endophyticus]|uniref:MFS transporter n=1 Tax=Microlunatus endophyticus TaxID=1716077 RepID=A0A917W2K8_9ACTN|nr:YbfB/YjiJ family MFS transporter [Microlunatus endophyticus]GGL61591.1 MFS transporter [Microlunatus endophyticus]